MAPPVVNDTGRVAVPLAKVRFTAFPGEAFTVTIGAVRAESNYYYNEKR